MTFQINLRKIISEYSFRWKRWSLLVRLTWPGCPGTPACPRGAGRGGRGQGASPVPRPPTWCPPGGQSSGPGWSSSHSQLPAPWPRSSLCRCPPGPRPTRSQTSPSSSSARARNIPGPGGEGGNHCLHSHAQPRAPGSRPPPGDRRWWPGGCH